MIEIKFFDVGEFDSKDAPGSGGNMRLSTLLKLDKARWTFGKKVRVTSGFRTKAYGEQLKKRGYEVATKSAHYTGYAVDVMPVGIVVHVYRAVHDPEPPETSGPKRIQERTPFQ